MLFGLFEHKHEWQYRNYFGSGPMRTTSKPDAHIQVMSGRLFHLKFCKCGKFVVDMGGEESLKIEGKIPNHYKDKYGDRFSEMYFVKDLLKEISYDLSMTFDKEFSYYVI